MQNTSTFISLSHYSLRFSLSFFLSFFFRLHTVHNGVSVVPEGVPDNGTGCQHIDGLFVWQLNHKNTGRIELCAQRSGCGSHRVALHISLDGKSTLPYFPPSSSLCLFVSAVVRNPPIQPLLALRLCLFWVFSLFLARAEHAAQVGQLRLKLNHGDKRVLH